MSGTKRARSETKEAAPPCVDFDTLGEVISNHILPDLANIVVVYLGREATDVESRIALIKKIAETAWENHGQYTHTLTRESQIQDAGLPLVLCIVRPNKDDNDSRIEEFCTLSCDVAGKFVSSGLSQYFSPPCGISGYAFASVARESALARHGRSHCRDVTDLVRRLPCPPYPPHLSDLIRKRLSSMSPARFLEWKGSESCIVKLWKHWLATGSPDIYDIDPSPGPAVEELD